MKDSIKLLITILIIVILSACAKLKESAKTEVSQKLHRYTNKGVATLIAKGVNDNLPPDIAKIIPMLKKFGFKMSTNDLDKKISKLSDKPIKTAEKIIHHAIDEMTLVDAIKLLTTSKSKAPMTNFIKGKTENTVNKTLKDEINNIFKQDSSIRLLNQSIKIYTHFNKNINITDISDYTSKIITKNIFDYVAKEEKADK